MTCILLLSSLLLLPLDNKTDGWFKLEPKGQGFAIEFPKEPKSQELNDRGPDDREVKISIYRLNVGGVSYLATISQFSPEYMKQDPKVIFDNARDGSIARSRGKLINEKDLKLGTVPGRETVVAAEKDAGFVRAQVFVANGRQYAVMVGSKTDKKTTAEDAKKALFTPEAERFFGSFKVLKQAE